MTQALGYCLAEITVNDAEAYKQYMARSGPAVAAGGGRFLVRGGAPRVIEGDRQVTRIALVEFPSRQAAEDFYHGAQYQEALTYRTPVSTCHYTLLTGNDPAQLGQRTPGEGKGYIYAEMHPTDMEKYMEYPKLSTPVAQQFGGVFIVRGGQPAVVEGGRPPGRVVVAEFASPQVAHDFYFSPAYQEAMKWRQRYAQSHLYLLQGA